VFAIRWADLAELLFVAGVEQEDACTGQEEVEEGADAEGSEHRHGHPHQRCGGVPRLGHLLPLGPPLLHLERRER
jgi:hypothetical protein